MLKKYPSITVLILLTAMAAFYNYFSVYNKAAYSNHAWRQSDCLSFTVNYYEEGMHFFEPSQHYLNETGDGKTISEFPIIYYSVAAIWHITGKQYFIFRLFNTLIVFAGLICLFKLCLGLFKSRFWAAFVVLSLFSSPVLAFYTNTFMADAPALGISLIAWFFFWNYSVKLKINQLYISQFFFLLAGLIKASALIGFATLLGIFFLELSGIVRFKKTGKLFPQPIQTGISMLLLILLMASWISFAAHYNAAHNDNIFLIGILPIWELSSAEQYTIMRLLYNELIPQFFPSAVLHGLIFCALIFITRERTLPFFQWATGLILLGFLFFILLFFQVFNVHEYYLLNMLAIVPVIFISLIVYVQQKFPEILNTKGARFAAGLLLFFMVLNAGAQVRMRYNASDFLGKNDPAISADLSGQNDYLHAYEITHQEAMLTASPWLKSLGIKRTDRVLSLPDQSPNISLSKLDLKGYTDYAIRNGVIDSSNVQSFIQKGVQYLIVNDTAIVNKRHLLKFFPKKLGEYQNLVAYRIADLQK